MTYLYSFHVCLDREFELGTSRPAWIERCSTIELSRPIHIHGSRQNYDIPPLTKFLPFKKITSNTCSPFQDLIDLTNIWLKMVTAPNETEMRENIKINNCLHKRKENVWTYKKYRYHLKKKISISHTFTYFLLYAFFDILFLFCNSCDHLSLDIIF